MGLSKIVRWMFICVVPTLVVLAVVTLTGNPLPGWLAAAVLLLAAAVLAVSERVFLSTVGRAREVNLALIEQLRGVVEATRETLLSYDDLAQASPERAEMIEVSAMEQRTRIDKMERAIAMLEDRNRGR